MACYLLLLLIVLAEFSLALSQFLARPMFVRSSIFRDLAMRVDENEKYVYYSDREEQGDTISDGWI